MQIVLKEFSYCRIKNSINDNRVIFFYNIIYNLQENITSNERALKKVNLLTIKEKIQIVLEEFSYCRIKNSNNDNRVIFSTILFIIFKKPYHLLNLRFKKYIYLL